MGLNRHDIKTTQCAWDSWYGTWTYWISGEGTKPCPHPHDTLEDRVETILRKRVFAAAAGPVGGIEAAVDEIAAILEEHRSEP